MSGGPANLSITGVGTSRGATGDSPGFDEVQLHVIPEMAIIKLHVMTEMAIMRRKKTLLRKECIHILYDETRLLPKWNILNNV
jgi:hypothetical protein